MPEPVKLDARQAARALGEWTARARGARALGRGLVSVLALVALEALERAQPRGRPALRLIRGGLPEAAKDD